MIEGGMIEGGIILIQGGMIEWMIEGGLIEVTIREVRIVGEQY